MNAWATKRLALFGVVLALGHLFVVQTRFATGLHTVQKELEIGVPALQHDELLLSSSNITSNDTTASILIRKSAANERNANRSLMTTLSGCHMTRWIYLHPRREFPVLPTNVDDPSRKSVGKFRKHDCLEEPPARRLRNMTLLQPGDSIYVPVKKLPGFVQTDLRDVQVPIVVISGQWQLLKEIVTDQHVTTLLQHEMVLAWFCQNVKLYYDYTSSAKPHSKVHPWPYGLRDAPFRHEFSKRRIYQEAVDQYRQIKKDVSLHLAYFAVDSNRQARQDVPNGVETSSLQEYYHNMARAHYVFSPNGDRPECYRHYEAIGLGTTPITQLDEASHSHLAGSVVFDNTNWSVEHWNSSASPPPTVDRNLIYEDYWIDYAERLVGRSLNWAQ